MPDRNQLPRELVFAIRPFVVLFHIVLLTIAGFSVLLGVVLPISWVFRHPDQIWLAVVEFIMFMLVAIVIIAMDWLSQKLAAWLDL